ncbi:MAG: hypothetical protein HY709_00025, partial [Candidatus Latescibacteria bacterium]|nr:hypothetical protein [Candidatus Latescibacterota bacterium]
MALFPALTPSSDFTERPPHQSAGSVHLSGVSMRGHSDGAPPNTGGTVSFSSFLETAVERISVPEDEGSHQAFAGGNLSTDPSAITGGDPRGPQREDQTDHSGGAAVKDALTPSEMTSISDAVLTSSHLFVAIESGFQNLNNFDNTDEESSGLRQDRSEVPSDTTRRETPSYVTTARDFTDAPGQGVTPGKVGFLGDDLTVIDQDQSGQQGGGRTTVVLPPGSENNGEAQPAGLMVELYADEVSVEGDGALGGGKVREEGTIETSFVRGEVLNLLSVNGAEHDLMGVVGGVAPLPTEFQHQPTAGVSLPPTEDSRHSVGWGGGNRAEASSGGLVGESPMMG